MKNLFVFLFLLSLNIGYAQIQEGTVVVGGGLNLNGESGKTVYDNYTNKRSNGNIGFSASYEKFKNPSTAFGFFMSYGYNNNSGEYQFDNGTEPQTYGYREHMIYVGPKISQYIQIHEKLYFTVQGDLSAGFGQRKYKETDEKSNIWSVGLNIRPGLALFLNENFALNAGIGNLFYTYQSEQAVEENANGEQPKNTDNLYGLSFNVNTFTIGLKYFLRTAKSD